MSTDHCLVSKLPLDLGSVDQAVQLMTDHGFPEHELHSWISSLEQQAEARVSSQDHEKQLNSSTKQIDLSLPTSECQASECNGQNVISEEGKGKQKNKGSKWTAEEHLKFIKALDIFLPCYDNFGRIDCNTGQISVGLGVGVAAKIASYVGTRTAVQVRSHAQKYFLRANKVFSS
eukprot:756413-Hanusia_phi.AAC.7